MFPSERWHNNFSCPQSVCASVPYQKFNSQEMHSQFADWWLFLFHCFAISLLTRKRPWEILSQQWTIEPWFFCHLWLEMIKAAERNEKKWKLTTKCCTKTCFTRASSPGEDALLRNVLIKTSNTNRTESLITQFLQSDFLSLTSRVKSHRIE